MSQAQLPIGGPRAPRILEMADKILTHADKLLSDRSGWCQRAYARAADGRELKAESDEAVQWCAESAVLHAVRALYPDWSHERSMGSNLAFDRLLEVMGDVVREAKGKRDLATLVVTINDGKDPDLAYQQVRQIYAAALGTKR